VALRLSLDMTDLLHELIIDLVHVVDELCGAHLLSCPWTALIPTSFPTPCNPHPIPCRSGHSPSLFPAKVGGSLWVGLEGLQYFWLACKGWGTGEEIRVGGGYQDLPRLPFLAKRSRKTVEFQGPEPGVELRLSCTLTPRGPDYVWGQNRVGGGSGGHLLQGGAHILWPSLNQDVAGHVARLATAISQLPPLPAILQHLQQKGGRTSSCF
jgi:hypothetical protein